MVRFHEFLIKVLVVLSVLIFGFLAFFIFGFWSGLESRKDEVKARTYAKLHYVVGGADKFLLEYKCVDAPTVQFNVETNEIEPNSPAANQANYSEGLGPPTKKHLALKDALHSHLGGPITGFTLGKTLARMTRELGKPEGFSKWKYRARLLASVTGKIAGDLIGRYAGSRWNAGCNSEFVEELLADKSEWIKFESDFFKLNLLEMELGERAIFRVAQGQRGISLHDDPVFVCNISLAQAATEMKEIKNPDGKDFQKLASTVKVYNKIKETSEYESVKTMNVFVTGFERILKRHPDSFPSLVQTILDDKGYTSMSEYRQGACAALAAKAVTLSD